MFPLTITLHNQAQFDLVATALTAQAAQAKAPAVTPAAPAAAPNAAAVVAVAAEMQPKAAQAPANQAPAAINSVAKEAPAAAKDVEEPAPQPVTYDQVKPLILKLSAAKGREAAASALGKFGVAKGPDLQPGQYADFVAHAAEVLAA